MGRPEANVDLSRLSAGAWWGDENGSVDKRLQSFLRDLKQSNVKRGMVALVAHSKAFCRMGGFPGQTFPRSWGIRRGWPKNFKPYLSNIKAKGGRLYVTAAGKRT